MSGTSSGLPALACVSASLRRAARAVTQRYDAAFRPFGIRSTQFTLLQALANLGEVRQGHLGDVLALDSTTLTRSLAPMERRGWLRARSGADRRERLWGLTRAGRRLYDRARPAWRNVQATLRRRRSDADWEVLLHQLAEVAEAARTP